jgi:hypothetical protein
MRGMSFALHIQIKAEPAQAFDASTAAFYNSTEFAQKKNESAAFLNLLPQFLDGRPVTLENMVRGCLCKNAS